MRAGAIHFVFELVCFPGDTHEVDDVDTCALVEALDDPLAKRKPHLSEKNPSLDLISLNEPEKTAITFIFAAT